MTGSGETGNGWCVRGVAAIVLATMMAIPWCIVAGCIIGLAGCDYWRCGSIDYLKHLWLLPLHLAFYHKLLAYGIDSIMVIDGIDIVFHCCIVGDVLCVIMNILMIDIITRLFLMTFWYSIEMCVSMYVLFIEVLVLCSILMMWYYYYVLQFIIDYWMILTWY